MKSEYVAKNSSVISKKIRDWGRHNFASYPWRFSEDTWLSLVAEIMLQRTRASSVVPVWTEFAKRFPCPESLIGVTEDEIKLMMRPLGLAWRVPLILKLAEALVNLREIPDDEEGLKKLPGIGDYAAAAVTSFKMNKRAVIVDANIVRWICRMTGEKYDGETRRQRWLNDLADKLTPQRMYKDYNYGALDFTINVCKSKPDCESCPVSNHCSYWGPK